MTSMMFPHYEPPRHKSRGQRALERDLANQTHELRLCDRSLEMVLKSDFFARLASVAMGDVSTIAAAVAMMQARSVSSAKLIHASVDVEKAHFGHHAYVRVYDNDGAIYIIDHVWFPGILVPADDYSRQVLSVVDRAIGYSEFWGLEETERFYSAMNNIRSRILTEFEFYEPRPDGTLSAFSDLICDERYRLGANYLPFQLKNGLQLSPDHVTALIRLGLPPKKK